jgi:hypothetical protein
LKKHVSNPTDEQKRQNHNDTIFKSKVGENIMANYEIDPAILLPFGS